MDNWLRYREVNGLVEMGAVFKKGKLLFINAERFVVWMLEEGELDAVKLSTKEVSRHG